MAFTSVMAADQQPGTDPHPVDVFVGRRLRARRRLLDLTQRKVAEQLGLTTQQIQKYESGTNRLSASRLYELSAILNVPVAYFFQDAAANGHEPAATANGPACLAASIDLADGILKLIMSYYGSPEPSFKQDLVALIDSRCRDKE